MAPRQHGETPEEQKQERIVEALPSDLSKGYHTIAQQLGQSTTVAEVGETLAPILNLPEAEQIAFLKTIGKENTLEAANVILATQTLTDNKNVRKEARRRLIQFESKDIYADWELPQEQQFSFAQALERFNKPEAEREQQNPFITELESLFSGAGDLFSEPAYIEIVSDFLESWAEGDFETAYDLLAENSPIRGNLSQEAWIAQRQQWAEKAEPSELKIAFIDPVENEDGQDQPVIEVGWSVILSEQATNTNVPELARATASFPETGRQWFLSRYTIVQGEDDWYILDVIDEGANLLALPTEELHKRITAIQEQAGHEIEELEEDLEDEVESEEGEDEEEEDEEQTTADLAETFQLMSSMTRLTTQILHHYDVLIAKAQASTEVFERATELALSVNEAERAAMYSRQWSEHVPEKRGEALRNFALICMLLAAQFSEEEDEEQAAKFVALAESTLRKARAIDSDPKIAIVLANVLVQQDKQYDEAEELLHKAQASATEKDDIISIEQGLGAIALKREDLEMALNHFKRVAHLGADDEDLWLRIGSLQTQLQQYDEAIPSLRHSIKVAPDLTDAYIELANVYVDQNKLTQAREVLREGVEENPDSVELLATLALMYQRTGDRRSAYKYIEQAEAIDPEDQLVIDVRQHMKDTKNQPKPKFRSKHKTKKK